MKHLKRFNESLYGGINSPLSFQSGDPKDIVFDTAMEILDIYFCELKDDLNYEAVEYNNDLSTKHNNYYYSYAEEYITLRVISSRESIDETIDILNNMENDLTNNKIEFKSSLHTL